MKIEKCTYLGFFFDVFYRISLYETYFQTIML